MRLLVLGLNHKTAPVSVREKFALGRETVRQGLNRLNQYPGLSEGVILSTCNRSEFYAACEEDSDSPRRFLLDLTGNGTDTERYLYRYEGEECIRHLFRVSASLDSLVLGEGQILSQVKAAYTLARQEKATGTLLNTLFHRAIAAGKRVRTETRIAYNSVSVSYAAVELAKKKLGDLSRTAALIYGAGKMAELTIEHLRSHGIRQIYIANRHLAKAEELAANYGGIAIPFGEAMNRAADVGIIVTSTGAPHYVVRPPETRQLMARRCGRPLFFIDIAVPRDVDPEVAQIEGVTLYNIDALEAVVDSHVASRREEAAQAAVIVEEEVQALRQKFQYLAFRPLMADLSERAEGIRRREVKRVASKLPDLTESEQRALESMTKMIVRKLLRVPMMKLNAAAGTPQEDFYREAMTALFRLEGIGEQSEATDYSYRYAQQ